jgi:stalled ribosome rescue protein Dom34
MLVAIAKHQGAQIRQEIVAEQHVARGVGSESVAGSADRGPHKPRGGALAHKQIQRRAEQALQRDAEDVVAELRRIEASFRPRVLVVAGEVQERTAIRDALPEGLASLYVDAERGDAQDHAAEAALNEQLRKIAEDESTRTAHARTEELQEGLAHGQAVDGADQVDHAAELGAVDTLLFEHEVTADDEASLLKKCAESGARADIVENDTKLTDGVAALLRFPLPD